MIKWLTMCGMLIGILTSNSQINYKNRLLHEREKEYGE